MDNNPLPLIIGAVVLAIALYVLQNPDAFPWPTPSPPIPPGPNVVIPESCRSGIESIRSMTFESKDAAELSKYFVAFAKTVDSDTQNLIDSAETIRLLNMWSGKMHLIEQNLYGKYPGLSDRVDDVIATSIGSKRTTTGFEPVTIDENKKRTLAQAFRAIAWAVQQ